jgi:hypothetical protein
MSFGDLSELAEKLNEIASELSKIAEESKQTC